MAPKYLPHWLSGPLSSLHKYLQSLRGVIWLKGIFSYFPTILQRKKGRDCDEEKYLENLLSDDADISGNGNTRKGIPKNPKKIKGTPKETTSLISSNGAFVNHGSITPTIGSTNRNGIDGTYLLVEKSQPDTLCRSGKLAEAEKQTSKKQKREQNKHENAVNPLTKKKKPNTIKDLGRGIEYGNNSCYLDSTLFSMFYYLATFDERFLKGGFSEETRDDIAETVTKNLDKIVVKLRVEGYCPSEYIADLRSSMSHINNRLVSTMMDVDELISNLFGKALHLQRFIKYTVGTKSFHHQILINPSKIRPKIGTVKDCLRESMQLQRLQFADNPNPALFIKMPRSNGVLVGFQYILPNLTLNISEFVNQDNEEDCTFDLMAVIVLRHMHYTSFVRCGTEIRSPWVYFNSLPANVTRKPDVGSKLQDFESKIGSGVKDVPSDLQQIMGDIHVCIYVPTRKVTTFETSL